MLLEKLKKALKKAGLAEELANYINITTEGEIEGVIASLQNPTQSSELDFAKILGSEEFSKFVNENGFDKVLELSKGIQSGHDLKVTQGIRTATEKFLKGLNPDDSNILSNNRQKGDDVPSWAKSLMNDIQEIKAGNQKELKLEKADTLMGKFSFNYFINFLNTLTKSALTSLLKDLLEVLL